MSRKERKKKTNKLRDMDPVEDKFFARGPEKSNEVARNTNLTFGIFPPRQHFIL